jgi:ABC-type sugar transport system ATPase subunit
MNLLPATATGDNEGLAVTLGGGATLVLPAQRTPRLTAGSAVTLGIRPEAISDRARDGGAFANLEAEVVQVEPLGAETIVATRVAGVERDVIARIGPDPDVEVGARCTLSLDMSAVRVFDASGDALTP